MPLSQVDIEKIKHLHDVDSATKYLYSIIPHSELLEEALKYAQKAHENQFRKSGEPYIVHPILVACIVATITNDESMAISGLLHDIVEDTEITSMDVETKFGKDVAHLVDGLTKIDRIRDSELIPSSSNERIVISALSFRKMLLASTEDVRVLVVKLCDRLHNMLTLNALPEHKQKRISEETLVVYAPIAHRLGISFLKNILEDLSFSYLFKEEKHHIDNYLDSNYHALEIKLNEFKQSIHRILVTNGFCEDDFEVLSRVKHRYSIYLKMQRKGVGIEEVLDLLAVRILTQDAVKCYTILGLIHLNFQPLSSRFKDYVAVPKENGYQTIHTTVFYSTAIFEVQIRTYEMHNTAELGVAAHWKYKSGGNGIKLDWLSNLQYQNESVEDFYELVKNDIYSKDISVFSPTGDPFTLPRGAVALDFAYAVHSEVGNKASSCLINKSKASLLSEVHNGDIVKINLSNDIITRCSWIDAVKTSRATTNMRLNCNNRIKEINIKSSINIVATAMSLNKSRVEEWFDTNHYDTRFTIAYDIESFRNVIYMYTQDISKNNRFKGFLSRHRFKLKSKIVSGLEVFSVSNITDVVFDYCCHPKAGDEIMAFLEKSKVHVHHKMCKSAAKMLDENQPMVFIRWEKEIIYQYNLIVSLHNEKGALAEFLAYLVKLDIDIGSIELGKRSSDYIKYCEIGFNSKEGNINSLRSKIENNIKVIHLIRKDDAYKK
ncbi:MAG: bifunctional (p)ppGpp synthetase/guanosine-3',5'-bis(diphosphate) 3'-pyrophosphohydrolase [Epsilonproteobacteria bacterium]|nr:bifunctional (p)ppGpp synthetase/guanosine-3',5'-bis(diphosphate) 3'-pyrophosphohydrolase [Campylobacterota bacterium]PIP09672.1 MAG: bifunctional (p)ppGpp synthase/hydrolase [Sulfurimonas sp. CG23_combo_of_CG06-09_8_20_14_all_36_33]PIS26217.1 MAG: bifunctional (p)ppGpp synthase/hydrolase [Sulfurimonas sp. CG08_land_8_20_14_0_20_36_33]PIU34301.1 MAG: bifunctional (p)ppGpp synthase/hydrolase [Sulfurimonas sp. CG07_land_8_20_14_0_80_36_56]PIV02599.1 MAG: bifunctional (p)ppGpp synthase/hydrolas